MKRNIYIAMMAILVIFFIKSTINTVSAQIKVDSIGRVIVGQPQGAGNYDSDIMLSASIFGRYGNYRAGSKLSFGDFGKTSTAGINVFIGEYGTTDSDALWLHGKNGIKITRSGQANDIVAYCNTNGNDAFYFNTNVFSKGSILTSDSRFKTNIKSIETPLSKIMSLEGVSYDYNDNIKRAALIERHNIENSENIQTNNSGNEFSEKENNNLQEIANNENTETQVEHKIGFIAQDLQQVLPDLVKEDDLGYLGIDYIGIIPVIVEAIKEQQGIVNSLLTTIDSLKEELSYCCNSASENFEKSKPINDNAAFLYQNNPNPFTMSTNISFMIPETANSAKIIIHNMQGTEIKSYLINSKKEGSIVIQGSELQAGMYMYTLLIDNTIIDTKRMILTK